MSINVRQTRRFLQRRVRPLFSATTSSPGRWKQKRGAHSEPLSLAHVEFCASSGQGRLVANLCGSLAEACRRGGSQTSRQTLCQTCSRHLWPLSLQGAARQRFREPGPHIKEAGNTLFQSGSGVFLAFRQSLPRRSREAVHLAMEKRASSADSACDGVSRMLVATSIHMSHSRWALGNEKGLLHEILDLQGAQFAKPDL